MMDFPGIDKAIFLECRFCPNGCRQTVFGKDLKRHIESECPNRMALCPDGCGERILGSELEAHKAACNMNVQLLRADAALRENALKEYRIAMAAAYSERDQAAARMLARGEFVRTKKKAPQAAAQRRVGIKRHEVVVEEGWATEKCALRVGRIEASGRDMMERFRRRAVEKLVSALAQASAEPDSDVAQALVNGEAVNAIKFWDAFHAGTDERGSRPWDLNPPTLAPLYEALHDAAECGADEKLRRRGEVAMLSIVRRGLEAAMETTEDRHAVLLDAIERLTPALKVVELTPWDMVGELYHDLQVEIHRAACNEFEETPDEFYDAVANGDTELCGWLLTRKRANPSAPDPRTGLLPMVIAAKAGDLPMCRLLIDGRADVDARGQADGCTALHWAAHQRNVLVMTTLLECRANPRIQDKRGQDALMKLVRREILQPAPGATWTWQVRHGERLKGPKLPCSGIMDLENAQAVGATEADCVGFCFRSAEADSGRFLEVQLVAPPGTKVAAAGPSAAPVSPSSRADSPKSGSPSPKGRASGRGSVGSPKGPASPASPASPARRAASPKAKEDSRPVSPKAEPEAPDEFWTTYVKVPLDPAHDIQMLLSANADPNTGDMGGLTALHHHFLSVPQGSAAVVAALVRGGADVNRRDETERSTTPLLLAVRSKDAELVRTMLTQAWPPADVDAQDAQGTSALALAEAAGARDVAKLLRDSGASAWSMAEVRLGKFTSFSFDTRAPPVPA